MRMASSERVCIDTDKDGVRKFYDEKARTHGEGLFKVSDDILDEYLILDRPWVRMLDAMCGVGHVLDRVKRLGRVGVGIDFSPGSVQVALDRGLDVRLEDVEIMSFADSSFDLVTCIGSLEHTPEPVVGLGELCRVSSKYVVVVFPVWHVDRDGPVNRHYKGEDLPNIERWLLPEEWDRVISLVESLVVVEERKLIHDATDIMYVLRKR